MRFFRVKQPSPAPLSVSTECLSQSPDDNIANEDTNHFSVEIDQVAQQEALQELLQSLDNTRLLLQAFVKNDFSKKEEAKPQGRAKSWWGSHCWPQKRRILYKNITLITLVLQFLNLMILTLIDIWPHGDEEEKNILIASSVTMIVLQVANLFILIFATGRLAKQVFRHEVNGWFLAQSYLAVLFLFAGIYTVTYRLDNKSWSVIDLNLEEDPVQVFYLYFKFLFYSISTATLCGSDNTSPKEWYNELCSSLQMLLSFCYFASILGSAMSPSSPAMSPSSPPSDTRTSPAPGPIAPTQPQIIIDDDSNYASLSTTAASRSSNPSPTPSSDLRRSPYSPLDAQQQPKQRQLQSPQLLSLRNNSPRYDRLEEDLGHSGRESPLSSFPNIRHVSAQLHLQDDEFTVSHS